MPYPKVVLVHDSILIDSSEYITDYDANTVFHLTLNNQLRESTNNTVLRVIRQESKAGFTYRAATVCNGRIIDILGRTENNA
jgi:hypothetical protein